MKGRLSSTIWMIVTVNVVAVLLVLWLAYEAGAHSGGLGLRDAGALGGSSGPQLLFAVAIGAAAAIFSISVLGSKIVKPVQEITEFSEKIAGGDNNARLEISSQNDFAVVAENWNRLAEKLSRTGRDQEAQDSLQKSIAELLTIINQSSRGDLTLRGKVTGDALGNVVESINSMLDSFNAVIERVRRAAVDVSTNANRILFRGTK